MMKSIAILCCEIILAHALGCPQNSTFMTTNDVSISSQLPSPIQAIIPTLQFECQSLITGGDIRAVGDVNFDLQIWRPQDNRGTFYNLVWRRSFRRSSTSINAQVTATFSSSPGIPVRPGDVIGFYSNESARLLFDASQQHNVFYVEAVQGPLCNFSLDGTGVRNRAFVLPLISLTYVNATNEELQAAERRLPLIGDTCTTVSFIIDNNIATMSTPIIGGSESSQGQGQQVSTPSSSSESVNGVNITEGESSDGFFLTLSLTEFILVIVVLAVVLISICVVITISFCCCMYVLHMAKCRGKDESISMNTNPVYDSIRTPTVQTACAGAQPPCAGGQQPTLIALVPPCNQAALQATSLKGCQQASSDRTNLSSIDSYSSTSLCHQQVRQSSIEDYSYPNLRLQLQERNNQRTSDGYIIVQPDHFSQNGSRENIHDTPADVENRGPRGLMDNTL